MTPADIEALIAEIDARWSQDPWSKDYLVASHIKAALREQAREIELFKQGEAQKEVHALRTENEGLRKELADAHIDAEWAEEKS